MTAEEILNKYWNGAIPVDIETIAFNAGIEIFYDKLTNCHAKKDKHIFTIRGDRSVKTRRFFIAYLMYFQFYSPFENKIAIDGGLDQVAVDFALELLIPKQHLYILLRKHPNITVNDASNVFLVHHQHISRRCGLSEP